MFGDEEPRGEHLSKGVVGIVDREGWWGERWVRGTSSNKWLGGNMWW